MAGPGRSRAFTLLEAVVALALLSGVIVATLSLRAQSVAAAVRIERRLAQEQAVEAALDRAMTGTLFPPPATDSADETPLQRWEGEIAGVPCVCERSLARMPDPLDGGEGRGGDREAAPPLALWRIVAHCGQAQGVLYTASAP